MRRYLILLIFASLVACVSNKKVTYIPKTECDTLYFDISKGNLNGVTPNLSQDQIKEWFSCYTKVSPEGSYKDCGGAVFYENHGFYFYTFGDFVEIRKNYKGRVSHDLMSKNREEIKNIFGNPMETKYKADMPGTDFFPMEYGCLRVKYENNLPSVISIHYNFCDYIDLCE